MKNFVILGILLFIIKEERTNGLCNLPLMQKYFLTGSKYSTYSRMKICTNVRDKCCTIVDEIKIQKMWIYRT